MENNQICSWKRLQRTFSCLLDSFHDRELISSLFHCCTASFVRKLLITSRICVLVTLGCLSLCFLLKMSTRLCYHPYSLASRLGILNIPLIQMYNNTTFQTISTQRFEALLEEGLVGNRLTGYFWHLYHSSFALFPHQSLSLPAYSTITAWHSLEDVYLFIDISSLRIMTPWEHNLVLVCVVLSHMPSV